MPEVMKTVSPQTIGDDHPCPGRSIFHFTFSVADHFSGTLPPGATPFMPCPRNPGQVAEGSGGAAETESATATVQASAAVIRGIWEMYYSVVASAGGWD